MSNGGMKMFDSPQHEKLAYRLESASERLDISQKDLSELVRKHRLRTFRVNRKQYLPNFEMDRLVSLLLQEQIKRDMEDSHA
jgi:hypothetical protein